MPISSLNRPRWRFSAAAARRFQRPFGICGIGGTIPFMGMLGEMFPQAQFVITGILGPKSNAHGPNEFLHIPYAKRLVGCVADLVAAHHRQFPK
jgi:acetylornithine deacetylase/succinyl-diaminopimelate desuccinylase-like protein